MKIDILMTKSYTFARKYLGRPCGVALCAFLFLSNVALPAPAHDSQRIEVKILSSHPDMVSGGSALVEVRSPAEIQKLSIWAKGREVTSAFHVSPRAQTLIGLVNGLVPGKNRLEVKSGGKVLAQLEIINHAITGPIFSDPHQTPFICETESAGLGSPLDADCSVKTEVTYIYKSTQPPTPAEDRAERKPGDPPAGFKVYDRKGLRPNDLAEVTTTEGKKVPYIVRWERGTINRAIYEVAFLHEPGTPLPDPWTATPGWNGRLVYSFGGGCIAGYRQGRPPDAINNRFLSLGYAHVTSSLNVFGNNCDDVISGETAAMVKEHFIKSFGVPVHTIGAGGSGGSMQQHLIGQNYPGLLDGIIPSASYPDIISIVPGAVDCTLLAHSFASSTLAWTQEQKTAVSGFVTWDTCAKESKGYSWLKFRYSPNWVDPLSCSSTIPRALVYNPVSNRQGARCDLYDNEVNVFGTDPRTGFARRPLDNVGVQYGLVAFNGGIISAEQFLELNEKVDGFDDDGKITATRMAGDPEALRRAYATGRVNAGGGGLALIPIIDIRTYNDSNPDIHDEYRSFVTRARLTAANGSAENQVMLTFPSSNEPASGATYDEMVKTLVPKMDQWLDNIGKDTSHRSVIEKIAAARPADIADACWSQDGEKIVEKRTHDGNGRCNQLFPPHGDPRIAAGEPLTEDILKCALKPVNPRDYVHPLTPDQLARLNAVFPQGVCDFTRPGIGQVPLEGTWRKY